MSSQSKKLLKILLKLGEKHSTWQVFSDFVELQALSISILYDPIHREERAKQHESVVKKYDNSGRELLSKAIEEFGKVISNNFDNGNHEDILGVMFHELELHNKYKGQFFTPQSICRGMCEMSMSIDDSDIKKKGYMSVMEPACGSGAMILSSADIIYRRGYNPRTQLCVLAADVDYKCACMAYVQLSMYGIPAVVLHGNSLVEEEYSRWYTPVYIMDKWVFRKKMGIGKIQSHSDEMLKMATDPFYAAFRFLDGMASKNNQKNSKIKA